MLWGAEEGLVSDMAGGIVIIVASACAWGIGFCGDGGQIDGFLGPRSVDALLDGERLECLEDIVVKAQDIVGGEGGWSMAMKADAERIREAIGEGMEQFAVAGVKGVCELVHPGAFDHIALGLVFIGDGADGALGGFDVFGVEGGKVLDDFEQVFGVFVAQASAKLHEWATTDIAEGDCEFAKADLTDQKDEFFGGEVSEGGEV